MVRRGLQMPLLVTTDGALRLISAIKQMWSKSLRQRCLTHKTRNILGMVSPAPREESKHRVKVMFHAPSLETAGQCPAKLLHGLPEVVGDRSAKLPW